MPTWSTDRERALYEIALVENALIDGYPPPGKGVLGSHQKSAIRIAADALGIDQQHLRNRIGSPDVRGRIERHYADLRVDWSVYRERAPPPPEPEPEPKPAPDEPPGDPIDIRRLRDRVEQLTRALRAAEQRAVAAEDIRADVLGLKGLPPTPIRFDARREGRTQAETIILFLSDLHWGERVELAAMDGLNSYSLDIAAKRLGRWTHAVCDLATKHWSGPNPDRILLILGGDLISGAIHNELAKTDELKPLPSVRDLADHLRHAVTTIKANVDCPIDIVSLAGNHGRTTLKPESKEAAATSHDVLVSDFLELSLRNERGIAFYAPPSPDALFSVYGWRFVASHGDRIGSRGGQGFIGPAATAARGMKRIIADYAARGVHVDLILMGHFHCRLMLEEGLVNGSLPGPTEFSRDGRYRPQPAMQLFLCTHPRRLISQLRWIEVGHPDEGSLYEPPPPDRPLRPRYRVRAVTERV